MIRVIPDLPDLLLLKAKVYGSLLLTVLSSAGTGAGAVETLAQYSTFLIPVFTALSALVAAVSAVIAIFRVRALHIIINSRLTELLAATQQAAHAAGMIQGRADERSDHEKAS